MTVTGLLDRIETAWSRVLRLAAWLNGLVVLMLALMITADVTLRWLTGRPIVGVFEISQVLFIPVIFWVLGLVVFTDRQVRVDVLSARARGRVATGLRIFDQILGLVFFGVLLWTGAESWLEAVHGDFVGMGMIRIPTALPVGLLVFGTFLLVVTLALLLLRSLVDFVTGRPPRQAGRPEAIG